METSDPGPRELAPEAQRLRQFLVAAELVSLASAALFLVLYQIYPAVFLLILAADVGLVLWPLLHWGRRLAKRNQIEPAIRTIATGAWSISIVLAFAGKPFFAATELLAVVPVIVALPYAGKRQILRVVLGTIAVASFGASLAVGEPLLDHAPFPELGVSVLVALYVPVLVAIYSLAGWHGSTRLLETLAEMREANRALQDSERSLERKVADRNEALERSQRAREAVRVSEERYRHASELMSDYSYAARFGSGGKLEIEWMTGAFTRITGYAEEEANELGWLGIIHPDDHTAAAKCLADALAGRLVELEYRIIAKDGSERWISARAVGVPDERTGAVILYSTAHDITQQRQAAAERAQLEEQMREAQKLESLGVLAGGIAHDFNNLLTVILGNSAILLRELPRDSEQRARAERIRKTAKYAAGLTNQMLTYTGEAAFNLKLLDLSHLVDDLTQLFGAAAARQARIECDCPAGLPRVRGDETHVRQVVVNLISNATEALGEAGGRVSVRTGVLKLERADLADGYSTSELPPGEYVYLEVSDTGVGMDAATQARIFDPFFTTKFSGRGLGLAAVLGIVRGHQGAIKLTSAPGEGTRFRVLFPAQHGTVDSTEEEHASPSESVDKGTVLVIDDEDPVRELAVEFLERAGYRVLVATGGSEGIRLFREHAEQISLVLLDLIMPDIGGQEVLCELRRVNPQVPIVVASGYTREMAADLIGSAELVDFTQKPYEPEQLLERVGTTLVEAERRRGTRQDSGAV